MLLYIALMAMDMFHERFGAAPGDKNIDKDSAQLSQIAKQMLESLVNRSGRDFEQADLESLASRLIAHCAEISRSGGAEIHNIAALAGGMIAQEVIKVITKQYIPVDNTCLFDGIESTSCVLRI